MAGPSWDDTEEVVPSYNNTTSPSWDDTEEIQEVVESPKTNAISMAESARRGIGQGLTMSGGDELGGAIQAGLDKVYGLFGESPSEINARLEAEGVTGDIGPTSSSEMYKVARDEERAANKAAENANPYTYRGSELFGNILTGIGTGAAGASKLGIQAGAKLLTKEGLKNASKLAALSGAEGAVQGGLSSEAETLPGVAQDALTTAAISAPLGAIAGPALSKAGDIASATYRKSAPTTIGAGIGGYLGYKNSDDSAPLTERIGDTLEGAAIGAGVGLGADVIGSGAKKLLGLGSLGEDLVTARKMGKEGISLFDDESIRGVYKEQDKALEGIASPIQQSRDTLAQKEAEAANKLKLAEAKKAEALRRAQIKSDESLKEAEKELLAAREAASNAQTAKERQQAAKVIESKTKSIISAVDEVKAKSGQSIESAYETLEKGMEGIPPMAFNSTKVTQPALEVLNTAANNAGEISEKNFINMAKEALSELSADQGDVMSARKLKTTLSELITNAPNNNLRRVLSDTYKSLNNELATQASEQGFEKVATDLAQANNTYHRALLADMTLGNRFVKGVKVDPRFSKTAGMLQKSAGFDVKAGASDTLNTLQTELSDITGGLTDQAFEEARQAANLAKGIKPATKEQLRTQIAPELTAREQAAQQAIQAEEEALAKQLADEQATLAAQSAATPKEEAALDVAKLVGEQTKLSDKIVPSNKLRDWSQSLTMPKKGTSGETTDRLKKLLGEEFEPKVSKAKDIQKQVDVIAGTKQKDVTSTSNNPVSQLLGFLGGVGQSLFTRGANIEGLAEKSIKDSISTITSAMAKAAPESLKQSAEFLATSAPNASRQLLKAAEATDPVKRKALLYMVSQDPSFRKLLQENKDMDIEQEKAVKEE